MKKLLLGTLATLCIALGLTIAKPVEANAASISIDTTYGEMALHEDTYTDYLMWKQDNGHYVVFYNGDITCSAITDTEATLSFPGTAVVYSSDNSFVRKEQSGLSLVMKYTFLPYYASTKDFTYTDSVNTINLSTMGYVTDRQAAAFTKKRLEGLGHDDIQVFRYNGKIVMFYWPNCNPWIVEGNDPVLYEWTNIPKTYQAWVFDGNAFTTESVSNFLTGNLLKTFTFDLYLFDKYSARQCIHDATNSSVYEEIPCKYGPVNSAKFDISAGTSDVEIEVVPTIVNITLPLNVGLAINVNAEDAVVHGDIAVTNNSKAPVKVKLHAVSSADIPFTNLIKPTDLPAELEWDLLNLENSQKYFAFGVKPEEEGDTWKSITATDYVWAESGFTPTELGIIAGSSSGALSLDARFGRVQTVEHDFTFSATFVAELQ